MSQIKPFTIEVKKGDSKAYCMCGLSKKLPFCDGSHRETHSVPMVVHYEKDETVYLCACEKSQDFPFCDGSHKSV